MDSHANAPQTTGAADYPITQQPAASSSRGHTEPTAAAPEQQQRVQPPSLLPSNRVAPMPVKQQRETPLQDVGQVIVVTTQASARYPNTSFLSSVEHVKLVETNGIARGGDQRKVD